MAHTTVRQRIVGNPGRRHARGAARKRKRSSNPGEILGFVLGPAGNPGRKRGNMAKTKKNRGRMNRGKSNPGHRRHHRRNASPVHHRHHHRRRHHNPGMRRHHRHHRRNPGMFGEIGPMVTNAVFVIVGALGAKLGAQAFLGTNNVGVVGYAGNAAVGAVLWFLADKVMKNKAAASGIVAGTLVQIILRVINDYTPFGQYVANLGMGDYQAQSFVTPQVLVDPWRNANIRIPNGWGAQMPSMPSASSGPAQMGGRRALPAAAAAPAAAPAGPAAATAPAASGMSGYGLYGGAMHGLYG
jgi:hypothetical protein